MVDLKNLHGEILRLIIWHFKDRMIKKFKMEKIDNIDVMSTVMTNPKVEVKDIRWVDGGVRRYEKLLV